MKGQLGEIDRRPVAHFVVGIGASAGGLEAIEHFFDYVPEDSGLTFVVVQHLSPDFKSLMDELLARHTKLPIYRVEDGMAIQPNSVYLIPRKKNMVLSFGKLMLTDQDQKPGPNLPIDVFFQSLAQDMGDRAIAVVLSGTGSDGSRGVKEIHEAGGLVIVQDPETAAFDGMPKAALATGRADLILTPQAMPDKILEYAQHPVRAEIGKVRIDVPSGSELSAVFSLLRRHFGVDFSLYKPSLDFHRGFFQPRTQRQRVKSP
jgi:two-component system CheB/CheR fusion protein